TATGSCPRISAAYRMSRARLRAFERADISGRLGRSGLHAAEVRRVTGVDLDLLALGDEQRHLDLVTGLQGRRLGAAGRAVADNAGLGVGDLEQHRGRELDVEHATVVGGHDRVLVLQQEVLGVADDVGRDLELVEGAGVHEDVRRAVVVEVLHGPLVDVGYVDLHVGVEGAVHGLAGLDVLQLRPDDGAALARLVVLEPDDLPELAVDVQHHAVLQVVGGGHAGVPLPVGASGPTPVARSGRATSDSSTAATPA